MTTVNIHRGKNNKVRFSKHHMSASSQVVALFVRIFEDFFPFLDHD